MTETNCLIASAVTYGNDADWSDLSDWQRKANPWTITLTNSEHHVESFYFWTGVGLTEEPSVADLINCLVSDSLYLQDEPEELTYASGKAIEVQTEKAIRLFGRDYWFHLVELNEEERSALF